MSNSFWVKEHIVLKSENSSSEWHEIEYDAIRLSWCKFQEKIYVIFNLFSPVERN